MYFGPPFPFNVFETFSSVLFVRRQDSGVCRLTYEVDVPLSVYRLFCCKEPSAAIVPHALAAAPVSRTLRLGADCLMKVLVVELHFWEGSLCGPLPHGTAHAAPPLSIYIINCY